jgi:hypothetical protein
VKPDYPCIHPLRLSKPAMRPLRPTVNVCRAIQRQRRLDLSHKSALGARTIHSSLPRGNIPQWPNPPVPQPQVTPLDSSDPHHEGHRRSRSGKSSFWKEWANSASFQAALTTVVGLGMVFGAGVGYLEWYKAHVLHRVSQGIWDPRMS